MNALRKSVTILLAAVVLVVCADYAAYAATGQSLLIGKANKATSTTTIQNTKGVALTLKSKTGKAPLAVNSTTKVANLNADSLDGLDSSAFAPAGAASGAQSTADAAGTAARSAQSTADAAHAAADQAKAAAASAASSLAQLQASGLIPIAAGTVREDGYYTSGTGIAAVAMEGGMYLITLSAGAIDTTDYAVVVTPRNITRTPAWGVSEGRLRVRFDDVAAAAGGILTPVRSHFSFAVYKLPHNPAQLPPPPP